MRYTRYDYKRKKGNNFFAWFLLIIILAIAIGIVIFKMFFQGQEKSPLDFFKKEPTNQQQSIKTEDGTIFKIIQCGLYSKKENAEGILGTLPKGIQGFIIEEDGKFKIMAGIFNEKDSLAKSEELTKSSINNFSVKCSITEKDTESKVKVEIINGYLQIVNKIGEQDVKSVNTQEFKKWAEEMGKKVDNVGKELEDLLNNIKELPDEYTKDDGVKTLNCLYNLIIKYKA